MKLFTAIFAFASLALADDPQRIRLTVERQDVSGKAASWRAMNPSTVFSPADKLRFRVSANFAGYLYVMNQGTSGSYELLFPRSDTGSENRIEAGKDYVVPVGQGWFRVTGPAGQDVVYFVTSPIELAHQYRPLPPPPPRSEVPAGLKPRCDDIIFKSRGECIDNSAGVRAVTPEEKLPENLSGAQPTPRELLFMQEKGSTVVSSPTPLSAPVVYELRLAHN